MRGCFRLMPSCVSAFSQGSISIGRVDAYLQNETELVPTQNLSFSSSSATPAAPNNGVNGAGSNGNSQNGSNGHQNGSNGQKNGNGTMTNGNVANSEEYSKQYSVFLKHCTFARNPKIPAHLSPTALENSSLTNISLAIHRGDLVGVVGGMASGKSTLITALSGELRRTKGVFHMFDKMVHVPNRYVMLQ